MKTREERWGKRRQRERRIPTGEIYQTISLREGQITYEPKRKKSHRKGRERNKTNKKRGKKILFWARRRERAPYERKLKKKGAGKETREKKKARGGEAGKSAEERTCYTSTEIRWGIDTG